jgi:hypothetical protein
VSLCEFETSSSKGTCGKELFAWARYKRGDVPEPGEFTYIDGRVKAKFPNAELLSMKREFVPVANSAEPTEVWWEFKWIVFNIKKGEVK